MTVQYVNKKSELTAIMNECQLWGYEVYRTRLNCNCPTGNRRNGILVVDLFDRIVKKVIRCRGCVNRKEAGHV